MRILVAARARGLQAIDGPYLKVRDVDGFRRSAASAAALGYDGKWVLHPDQIDVVNQAFAPSPDEYARATRILEAYAHATGGRGARRGHARRRDDRRGLAQDGAWPSVAQGPRGRPDRILKRQIALSSGIGVNRT